MPTSLFRPKSTLSFLGHIHLDSRCASWKHNWSTTCWLQCFAWNRTRHGWRVTMCLVWQTELCQALNLHWVEESQVQKCDYSGVILVSIWTRAGHEFGLVVHSRLQVVCSCITNWRRLFWPTMWTTYKSCVRLDLQVTNLPYRLVISVKTTRNYSRVFMWTCYSWSCNYGARVAPAQSRSVRQLDHSRNVKFPDEHLPKFKWYIFISLNTFWEVQRLRLRIQYFTEH